MLYIFIGMKSSYVKSYFYWHYIISSYLTTRGMTGDNMCQLVNMLKSKRNDLSLKVISSENTFSYSADCQY